MKISDKLVMDGILITVLLTLLGIVVAIWLSPNTDKTDKEILTLGLAFLGYFIYNELTKKYSKTH